MNLQHPHLAGCVVRTRHGATALALALALVAAKAAPLGIALALPTRWRAIPQA